MLWRIFKGGPGRLHVRSFISPQGGRNAPTQPGVDALLPWTSAPLHPGHLSDHSSKVKLARTVHNVLLKTKVFPHYPHYLDNWANILIMNI